MHDNLSFKRENIRFEENKSLSGLTFFSSRGKAKFYTEPETVRELREAILIAKEKGLKITVIGSGTHTILPDLALNGLLLSTRKLKGMTIKGSLITAMAGESLDSVINTAIEHNLMGLEDFGGIPGTIAAAIKINATSQGKSIGEYHFYTDTMTFDGKIHRKPDYLDFFNSNKTIIDEDEIILSTTLRLKEGKRTAEARIRKERFIELMFVPPCKNFIGNVFKDGDDYKLAAVNSRGSYDNIEIDSGTLGITVNGVGPASISSIKPSTDSPYQEMVVNFTVSGENLDGRTMYLGFYSSQDTSTKITPVNTSRFNANNHVQFTGTNYIGIQYADVFDAGTHYFHLGVSLNDNDTNVVFSEMMEYWNQPGGVSP